MCPASIERPGSVVELDLVEADVAVPEVDLHLVDRRADHEVGDAAVGAAAVVVVTGARRAGAGAACAVVVARLGLATAAVVVPCLFAVTAVVVSGLTLAAADLMAPPTVVALVLAADLRPPADGAGERLAVGQREDQGPGRRIEGSDRRGAVAAVVPGAGQAGQGDDSQRGERRDEQAAEAASLIREAGHGAPPIWNRDTFMGCNPNARRRSRIDFVNRSAAGAIAPRTGAIATGAAPARARFLAGPRRRRGGGRRHGFGWRILSTLGAAASTRPGAAGAGVVRAGAGATAS